jgi:serine/threonine protein phosphatase 1
MPSAVLVLPENKKGRDFAVGDIHATFSEFERGLQCVAFDPEKDRVICVGDLINRGPESDRSPAFLAQPWFFCVRGNHEDIFIQNFAPGSGYPKTSPESVAAGFRWTFNAAAEKLADMRSAFLALPLAIEVETSRGTVGIVHADIPPGMDWQTFKKNLEDGNAATMQTALYSRRRLHHQDTGGVPGVGRIFFGHTTQENGVHRLGNCFYIDTGSCYARRHAQCGLTLIEITARKKSIIATPQRGPVRVITEKVKSQKPFKSL